MDAQTWERARELFATAQPLRPNEWDRFIRKHCDDDTSLAKELRSLLVSDRQAHGFLEPPKRHDSDFNSPIVEPIRSSSVPSSPPSGSLVGRTIGPYRLLRHLGEGGVGAVYLAERADGEFQKRVALKLLKRGMDTDEIVRRFRNERQILAGLHHPNIADLLDGGSTDSGLPYLVMEYVKGKPLDVYCEKHSLSIPERLKLFCAVCRTVHFAHQNLVVHRDLKPSNILVTEDGVPKLLDFGIAKLLNPELSICGSSTTEATFRMMTPDFASPEQVSGEAITTASDVYSLGVVLYLLLSGRRPYRIRSGSSLEMERVICEGEPPRVDAAVAENHRNSSMIASLKGDLANIVAMAMRKEPRHRYSSAEQLAADVDHYLDGKPVLASDGSLAYLFNKFLKRHRVAVCSLMVLLIAGLMLGVFMTAQQKELRAALAREQFATKFLTGLFEISDPLSERASAISARELLDRGRDRLSTELDDQPEYQARLMGMVGAIYGKLGELEEAERLLRQVLSKHREPNAEVASNLVALAEVLIYRAEYTEAQDLAREALEIREDVLGDRHPAVADSLNVLAGALKHSGRLEEAEPLYRRAVNTLRSADEHPILADSLNNLAILLQGKAELAEAEPLLREALAIRRKFFSDDHPLVANSLNNLAALLQYRGSFDESELHYREAMSILRDRLGDKHPDYAQSLLAFSGMLLQQSLHLKAEAPLREAVAIFQAKLPSTHFLRGYSECLLATSLIGQKRFSEAMPLLQSGYEVLKARTGAQSPYSLKARERLTIVYEALGLQHQAVALNQTASETSP